MQLARSQLRTLRPGETKWLDQSHTASKGQSHTATQPWPKPHIPSLSLSEEEREMAEQDPPPGMLPYD